MTHYFITGLTLGLALPHFLSDRDFDIIYESLFQPHRSFNELRKKSVGVINPIDHTHYLQYFKTASMNTFNLFYYYTIGKRKEFIKLRQEKTFELFENFEFAKETIDNYDYIVSNVQSLADELPGTYKYYTALEEEYKKRTFSSEDENIENMLTIKEQAKEDYDKYLTNESIVNKTDYLKSLSPEFIVQKETNRLRLLEEYNETIRQKERERKGEDLQERADEYSKKTAQFANEKYIKKEEDDLKEFNKKKQLDVKEKPDIAKKYPTLKGAEKELEALKEFFGSK